jgi:phenylpyruvate tautomerase PptA (4-oxalocrotonate tautomerase family)
MPLVKIETRRWMTADVKRSVLAAVHAALVAAFKVPDDDRNQRVIEYDADDFVSAPGKGERFTIVTIDAFAGRSLDAKRQLYKEMASKLAPLGIPPADLVVVVNDVPLDNWGVRGGQAACDINLGFKVQV